MSCRVGFTTFSLKSARSSLTSLFIPGNELVAVKACAEVAPKKRATEAKETRSAIFFAVIFIFKLLMSKKVIFWLV
jgi:hypothetical protein